MDLLDRWVTQTWSTRRRFTFAKPPAPWPPPQPALRRCSWALRDPPCACPRAPASCSHSRKRYARRDLLPAEITFRFFLRRGRVPGLFGGPLSWLRCVHPLTRNSRRHPLRSGSQGPMGIVWEEYEDMRDGCGYLVVADVVPNSPAAELRLSVGSVLQTLNGTPVAHMPFEDLPHWISTCRPLQLGFSAPVEEGGSAAAASGSAAAAETSDRSHRMLSPRRQSRGNAHGNGNSGTMHHHHHHQQQQPMPPANGGRNAFSARTWGASENVLSRGSGGGGLDSLAAARACSAVTASASRLDGVAGCGGASAAAAATASAAGECEQMARQPLSPRAVQHIPRPPAAARRPQ
jgi:hypothetical protein